MNTQQGRLRPEMASFRLLVLAFVREYLERHRVSPSYGEISAALDCSRTRVKKAVLSLARDGLLIRTPGPRGLRLPTLREEVIRQARELGFRVNEGVMTMGPPGGVTNPPLLPPASLTYPKRDGEQGGTGPGKDASRAA